MLSQQVIQDLKLTKRKTSKRKSRQPGKTLLLVVGVLSALTGAVTGAAVLSSRYASQDADAKSLAAAPGSITEAGVEAVRNAMQVLPVFPKLSEPLNVLVMGVDWNGEDAERYVGTRSDTMMLVSLDPGRNKVGIVSIPRDSKVELARGKGTNKINQAHALGGPRLAMQTVAENFAIPVQHYVTLDTRGLRQIFDLIGPIEVIVEKEMHYHDKTAGLEIDLMPGKQLLNAQQLEGYVRFRHDARADIGRVERQQWLLRELSKKLRDPVILLKAPKLLQIAYESVKTNLDIDDVAAVLSFVKDVGPDGIVTATLPGHPEMFESVSFYILHPSGSSAIFDRLCFSSKKWARERRSITREINKNKIRLSIKHPQGATGYARDMAHAIEEKGWVVKQIYANNDDECQHAQLDINTVRGSSEVLEQLRQDLPSMCDWPTNVRYGIGCGGDITIVLPSNIGLDSWQSKYKANLQETYLPPMSR